MATNDIKYTLNAQLVNSTVTIHLGAPPAGGGDNSGSTGGGGLDENPSG